MYFFVCHIFLSAFILVQCQEFQHEEVGPHKFEDVSNCAAERNQIRDNRMKAMPMPRERLVTLIPEHGYEYNPRTVTVKRCNGYCPGRWSPTPMKTQMKKFIVHQHQKGNPRIQNCVAVEVSEHMQCKCMCMHSEKDCKPWQEWIPFSCSCQCRDRKTLKSQCEARFGMEWYEDDCSCACTHKIMDCRSGKIWNKEVCDCV